MDLADDMLELMENFSPDHSGGGEDMMMPLESGVAAADRFVSSDRGIVTGAGAAPQRERRRRRHRRR